MHELSLMENVVEILREDARMRDIKTISRVRLNIGRLTMVLPDSMHFAFEILSQDDLFAPEAVLEIEMKEILAHCLQCERDIRSSEYVFACPDCQSPRLNIIQGQELNIDFYEGE